MATTDMTAISPELVLSLGVSRLPNNDESNSLATIIQRINFERGSFQTVTEETLRREIAEIEAASGNEADDDASENEEPKEEEKEGKEEDRAMALVTAKTDILEQIESAHQAAMFALDFVSLLLSKDMPNQGGATLSPYVREAVGTGTLGMDKLHAPRTTEAQKKDDKHVAKGWKAQNLNKTVDSILASATRLEKEIETETKYWEQVLAVTENGWAVCRLPNERHTLGVRFGFSEASPAFKSRSLGALRRNADGTISLDQGSASAKPRCIRVRIMTDGVETGCTVPMPLIPEDAATETLIKQARDTIFCQELWQELNRESRSLLSFGVVISPEDETVSLSLSPNKTAVIDLVTLSQFSSPFSGEKPEQNMAEGIYLALHLALSWSHRQAHRRRTLPPAPISPATLTAKPEPLPLLRPLLNRHIHQQSVASLSQSLSPLTQALQSAGFSSAHFAIKPTVLPPNHHLPKAEQVFNHLAAHLETIAHFELAPASSMSIVARTSMNTLASYFSVQLSPESILRDICPAAPQFSCVSEVKEWIFWAVGCTLAASFTAEHEEWQTAAQPTLLEKENKRISFVVGGMRRSEKEGQGGEGVRLCVTWDGGVKGAGEKGKRKGEGRYDWVAWSGKKEGADGIKKEAMWDDGEGELVKSLREVLQAVV